MIRNWVPDWFNAYRAQRHWIKAHGFERTFALHSINRALALEPDPAKIPEYLELKGYIQKDLGRTTESVVTFEEALRYIDAYPRFCSGPKFEQLADRVKVELEAESGSA